jgi:polar amino acid transport system substrate-binding protein
MLKRFAPFFALLTACLLLLGACSSDDDSNESSGDTTTTAANGTDLSSMMDGVSLVSNGKLTVCSDIPYQPFEFEDDAGQTTGFDFDLVASMSTSLGLEEPSFQTTPFDSIIPALVAGNCDIIASAMTITEERQEQALFTDPYFDADQSLLVTKANEATYPDLASLAGQTIGVQSETTGADYAEENKPAGATIQEFEGASELFAALTAGTIQAVLQDFPVNAFRANEQPDEFVVTEVFQTNESYGIAMAKENTKLQAALNAALADFKSSGGYNALYEDWFGTTPDSE